MGDVVCGGHLDVCYMCSLLDYNLVFVIYFTNQLTYTTQRLMLMANQRSLFQNPHHAAISVTTI